MSDAAVGIHDHPSLKLGRRPPSNRPALRLADILTGAAPAHPAAADHLLGASFGLYENDRFGVCGPTATANDVRLVSYALTGSQIEPGQDDVFDLYRRSGNPDFDPATGAGDNGVDMQTMLEALLAGGIGDGKGGKVKPIAFAKVDVSSDAELDAAVSIFGGVLWGVNLLVPQQAQTNASPPVWDYQAGQEWGGHAILDGKYVESSGDAEVISWALDVATTPAFRRHQLEEAWVVVWPWNVDHPAFQQGVDLAALQAAYHELTGKDLPVSPQPAPGPGPAPAPSPSPGDADAADQALFAALDAWSVEHHVRENRHAAEAFRTWAAAKGFPVSAVAD